MKDKTSTRTHVCVVGAGIIGLSSAHYLEKEGFKVTVIDRQDYPANEASYANAALLMRSYSRPKTMSASQMATSVLSKSHPVHIALGALADAEMINFGLRFLLAGPQSPDEVYATTQIIDTLAENSRNEIEALTRELSLKTNLGKNGLLIFFKNDKTMRAAIAEAAESFPDKDVASKRYRIVNPQECIQLEPALKRISDQVKGGSKFWLSLSQHCK